MQWLLSHYKILLKLFVALVQCLNEKKSLIQYRQSKSEHNKTVSTTFWYSIKELLTLKQKKQDKAYVIHRLLYEIDYKIAMHFFTFNIRLGRSCIDVVALFQQPCIPTEYQQNLWKSK